MQPLDEIYTGLRDQVLSSKPHDFGFDDTEGWSVYAFLMETAYDDGIISFLSAADGTNSLYYSNGSGIIGAGENDNVRIWGELLLGKANRVYKQFSPANGNTAIPRTGETKIFLLTVSGCKFVEGAELDFGDNRHVHSEIFHYAHNVISEIRNSEIDGEA